MKKSLILLSMLVATISLNAQNAIDRAIDSVAVNNTELKAALHEIEAAKSANLATATLTDPEVEFGYLFGEPSALGKRRDFSVSQSFDFATLTGSRRAVVASRNELLAVEYKAKRMTILTEARRICIETVYYNVLKVEADKRLAHAQTVADAYTEMLEAGTIGNLEYNKAMLNLSAAKGVATKIEIEREMLAARLTAMNGGEPIEIGLTEYPETAPLTDFDSWYAEAEQKNPVLEYARGAVTLGREELRQTRNEALPTITAGYMSEVLAGESFRGITAGVSIPLWSSRRRINSARQAVVAAESRSEDARIRFMTEVKAEYRRADALGETAAFYRSMLEKMDNSALLDEALDEGEISLLDYIVEIGIYYDTIDQTISAERDYHIALANLRAYTME